MDDDIDDSSSDFLPDLNNEKMSEQLLFDLKVSFANKQFIRIRTDIIKWILSAPENRSYPHVKNNKRAFRQTVLQYSYDKKRKKLFKRCICHDKIGK